MKRIFIFQFLFLILCWNWYKFDMFQKLQGQQLNYCQVNMTLGSWPNSQNREIDASQRDPTFLTQIAFLAFQLMKSWISRTFCRHSFVFGKFRTIMNLKGGGHNVEFQNVDRPKISERRNGLFSWSERRKSKRSERRKWPTYGVLPS